MSTSFTFIPFLYRLKKDTTNTLRYYFIRILDNNNDRIKQTIMQTGQHRTLNVFWTLFRLKSSL